MVLRWDEGSVEVFRNTLKNYGGVKDLENVLQALPRVEVRNRKEEYYEERWWGAKCHRRKEELKKVLEGLREGLIEDKKWRKQRRDYRNFLEGKKRSKNEE